MEFKTKIENKYFFKDTVNKVIQEKYNGDVSSIPKPESLGSTYWNNMKRSLLHHRCMTMGVFIVWANILDIDVEVTVTSKK